MYMGWSYFEVKAEMSKRPLSMIAISRVSIKFYFESYTWSDSMQMTYFH